MSNTGRNGPDTFLMGRMGVIFAGLITVDRLTENMLPITASHFTANLAVASLVVALHRMCGCFVQPYAAWKSDRHCGRLGRRRPFILGALPPTLIAVCLVGAFPFVVRGRAGESVWAIAALVVLNLAMQAGEAVGLGCVDPLYGDSFSWDDLGRASGLRQCVQCIIAVLFAYVAVPMADRNEFVPYAFTAAVLGLAWVVARFGLKEPPAQISADASRYDPLRPLSELRDPYYARVALVASAILASCALVSQLHALFVTRTLGLSKTDFGRSMTLEIVLSFVSAYPIGVIIDRWGPRRVLAFGFVLVASTALAFAFLVRGALSLYLAVIPLAIGIDCMNLPIVPIMYRNAPPARRGSIFAAVQTVRAAATFVAVLAVGQVAQWYGSIRVCYVAGACTCVIGLVATLFLSPARGGIEGRPVLRGDPAAA